MNKNITLKGKPINYRLRRSHRAKNLRLTISATAGLAVTKPSHLSDWLVEIYLKRKADWILQGLKRFQQNNNFKTAGDKRARYQKYQAQAGRFINERVEIFNQLYNYSYKRISIRNQKTRWGSCSKKGNLNFNYRLLFLPKELADYIVVHELCHLKEFNHSRQFWSLVEQTVPDHKQLRRRLKKENNLWKM